MNKFLSQKTKLLFSFALVTLVTIFLLMQTGAFQKKEVNVPSNLTIRNESVEKSNNNEIDEVSGNFIYAGTEYVTYSENNKTFQLDPLTGNKTLSVYSEGSYYPGNLGEWIPVSQKTVSLPSLQGEGLPNEIVTSDLVGKNISPINGNVIVYDHSKDYGSPTVTIHSEGLPDYVLKTDKVLTKYGDYFNIQRFPLGWIDKTHLLVDKGEPDAPIEGTSIIDISTGEEKVLLKEYSYIEQPLLSPSGRYLAYVLPKGKYKIEDYGETQAFLYDIQTGKITKLSDSGRVWGWTTRRMDGDGH